MKSPAGQPRARRPVQRKQVQLNLRRTPTWPEEDELDEPRGNFWKWFAVVLLAHVVVLAVLLILLHTHAAKPPLEFMQVMPSGDLAKGTPGAQAAPKIAPTTPLSSHTSTPVPPEPTPVKPVPEKPKIHHVIPPTPAPKPPPILKDDAREQAPPVKPHPPKVAKVEPAKPKIKVDLSQLVNAPDTDEPKPAKAKPHPKKVHHTEEHHEDAVESENDGLTPAQIAAKLGAKLEAEGTDKGTTTGPDGSTHSNNNDFAEFKNLIHDKVMSEWSVPNSVDPTAVDPLVRIHIDKDGYVPPDSVSLERSSNNLAIDQSALEAARKLGHLSEPLPDGFPPDTSISFNLQQQ
jgi:outer membrane biosynthesis protein TonB